MLMIDPVTAIAGATAAFNAIKKGIQVGKDIQDMGGTLAKWSGALTTTVVQSFRWWRRSSSDGNICS
jgi:hypothetical protein